MSTIKTPAKYLRKVLHSISWEIWVTATREKFESKTEAFDSEIIFFFPLI